MIDLSEKDPAERLQVDLTVGGTSYRHYFPLISNPYRQQTK